MSTTERLRATDLEAARPGDAAGCGARRARRARRRPDGALGRRDRGPEPVRRPPRRGRPPRGRAGDRGGHHPRRAGLRGDPAASLVAPRRDSRPHRRPDRRAARRARAHDRARGRQARQDRARGGRACLVHVPRRRGGDEADLRRDRAARLGAGHGGPHGARPPRPARSDRRHLALQLPAQSRRAQGGSGAGGREPDRHQARLADTGERVATGPDRARGRLARGRNRRRPQLDRCGGAARRGRPDQDAHLHGQPGRRLGAEGARRPQARHARARRQRGRDRQRATPTWPSPPSAWPGAGSSTPGRPASPCSVSSCTRRSTTPFSRSSSPAWPRCVPAIRSTRTPTSAR